MTVLSLPPSDFLNDESRAALDKWATRVGQALASCSFDPKNPYEPRHVPAIRQSLDEKLWPALIAKHRRRYSVEIEPATIGGVYTEVITPAEGISARNRNRVLINLHGGGFEIGGRYGGQVESIPVAALGQLKVLSVDYRMAPENVFPAATQDVVAVYRELLQRHDAKSIGIYGCSAGAVLTAEVVAQLLNDGMALPGAVGLFCGAGSYWNEGDSGHYAAAIGGHPLGTSHDHPYFRNADPADPLVFPSRSPQALSRFPPTLLISSTRDQALSSVVHMHSRFRALDVEAELHVWEGLGHAFFYDPNLPQSREVHDVTAKFFDRYLEKT